MHNSRSEQSGAYSNEPAEQAGLTEVIDNLRSALALLADKSLRLVLLESRVAALSLSTMLLLAVVVALLLFSAWLLCLAASVVCLVGFGLTWELALLAGAGVNILLSFPAMQLIRVLSRRLMFSATRRQLRRGLTA